jgi:hypothetical protein
MPLLFSGSRHVPLRWFRRAATRPSGWQATHRAATWFPKCRPSPILHGLRKYTAAAMTKPIYFRVSGLSPDTAADIESYLTGQLQHRLSDSEKSLEYTIHKVQACYSTKDSPSSVAIIRFGKGTPEFLVPLMLEPLDEITIEDTSREGRKSRFTIDRHFHGFTQLYETDPKHEVTAE